MLSGHAMPKTLEDIQVRGTCAIIYDNVYNYSVTHGYSECESQEMAAAAFLQCEKTTKKGIR